MVLVVEVPEARKDYAGRTLSTLPRFYTEQAVQLSSYLNNKTVVSSPSNLPGMSHRDCAPIKLFFVTVRMAQAMVHFVYLRPKILKDIPWPWSIDIIFIQLRQQLSTCGS